MFVAGGGSYTASAELYDPATNRWTQAGSMNIVRGAESTGDATYEDAKVHVARPER